MDVDVLIKNGRVIDTHNETDDILDVAIKDGAIFTIGHNLQMTAGSTYDASGCLITPGLIDAHVHCYQYATPLGVNVDDTCLARGVTTVIDAGSSGMYTLLLMSKHERFSNYYIYILLSLTSNHMPLTVVCSNSTVRKLSVC